MRKLFVFNILLLILVGAPSFATAQTPPSEPEQTSDEETSEEDSEPEEAEETPDEEAAEDADETSEGEEEPASEPDEEGTPPLPEAKETVDEAAEDAAQTTSESEVQAEAAEEPNEAEEAETTPPEADADAPFGESPIADLADEDFVPLEDIEEGSLEQIIPANVYPYVDWDGLFRVRTGVRVNFDLDTRGTSAILPPVESYTPIGDPADQDADSHWTSDLRLRLDPTLHLAEDIRVHTELDVLQNAVFGSTPAARLGPDTIRPNLNGRTGGSSQFSPREREWFQNALLVNELYGEVTTLLGTISAGRMDDEWGLGIFTNSGDCFDCDYGSHTDRIRFMTRVWELYGTVSRDFPAEGITSVTPNRVGSQPFDLSQIDDTRQWTFEVFRKPVTREDLELQRKRLLDDAAPVINGGGMYRWRSQRGFYDHDPGEGVSYFGTDAFDPQNPPELIYRGFRVHIVDLWLQFLYEPNFDTYVRIELEGLTALGQVDNASGRRVGVPDDTTADAINCFDDDEFGQNEQLCTTDEDGNSTSANIQQFALALETEFRFGGPVSFGLNGGLSSGGDTPNWGTSGRLPDLEFNRFHPDYQVDLILWREVVGTVTNAYYLNPYAVAEFLESANRKMQFQLDAIGSRAFDVGGTPSGESAWLGLEFDGALRYIRMGAFTAALEGGILFPFGGLGAVQDRPRYTVFGSNPDDFTATLDPSLAWTVQAKLFWNF